MNVCEFARYAPNSGQQEMGNLFGETADAIGKMEEHFRKNNRNMKRICIFLTLIFVLTCSLQAQKTDATNSIKRANEMYKQGQYSDAAALYEEILKNGVSPELYYNLGNSYYKADETGLAILNYERALRLDPGLNDASYNLISLNKKWLTI